MASFIRNIACSLLLLGGIAAFAQPLQKQDAPAQAAAGKPAVKAAAKDDDAGDRAFQANCNRCHNAPQQLNSRITGTVLRHMRVRANLSAEDEQAILRFLNP